MFCVQIRAFVWKIKNTQKRRTWSTVYLLIKLPRIHHVRAKFHSTLLLTWCELYLSFDLWVIHWPLSPVPCAFPSPAPLSPLSLSPLLPSSGAWLLWVCALSPEVLYSPMWSHALQFRRGCPCMHWSFLNKPVVFQGCSDPHSVSSVVSGYMHNTCFSPFLFFGKCKPE